MEDFSELDEQAFRDALHAVSVPARLQARISERLRLEAQQSIAKPLESIALPPEPQDRVVIGQPASSAAVSRRAWLVWGGAASAAVVLLGLSYWARPASIDQLSQYCYQQLDQLLGGEANQWNREVDSQLPQLEILVGQLRGDIRIVGYRDCTGSPIGGNCRLWNLYSDSTHKPLYLFDFRGANEVKELTKQLRTIKSISGGWSLAAMRLEDRVLVVLFEGAPDSYLYRPRAA